MCLVVWEDSMAHASYINGNDRYEVRFIEDYSMIDTDADEALKLVDYDVEDIDEYKAMMKQSVDQKLAFDIWCNCVRTGYVYNRLDGYNYLGCSINVNYTMSMILAFKTMFEICDIHKIVFQPHGGNISKFKSLIYGPSYRLYNNGKKTVTILKEDVYKKGYEMFHYLGMEWLTWEV